MEIGNMCFGHSRGNFKIPRHAGYEKKFEQLLTKIGDDSGYGIKYENDTFSINPYCWCESEDCPQCGLGTEFNFLFKKENIGINWYKYPFRDSYSNIPIDLKKFYTIIDACITSVDGTERKENGS